MAANTMIVPASQQQDWWETLQQQAQKMVDGGLFAGKIRTVDQMITIGLAARDLNIGLVDAARNFHFINNTMCMGIEIMLALVRRCGKYGFRYDRSDAQAATFTIWLREFPDESFTTTFTMEDAKAAGVTNKDNWKKFPDTMLRWRAVGNAVRAFAPDVLRKAYTPDEMGATIDFDASGEMIVTSLPAEHDDVLPVLEGNYETEGYVLPDKWRVMLTDWMVRLDVPADEQAAQLATIQSEDDAKRMGMRLKAEVKDMAGIAEEPAADDTLLGADGNE